MIAALANRLTAQRGLGGDGQGPANHSAGHPKGIRRASEGHPKGIRRVSEGYPKGLSAFPGGFAALGLGWRSLSARESGFDSVGQVSPTVQLLHYAEDDPGAGPRLTILLNVRPPLDTCSEAADSSGMFRRLDRATMLLTFVSVTGPAALGCDLCAIYGAMEAQGGSGRGFFGGVAEQYTYFGTFQSGGHDAPNPDGEYLNSLNSQAFVGYNFNDRFGLQFNLPVIYRDYGKIGAYGSEAGIGDVSLIGNVRLYEKLTETATFRWTALGGIKFPTGNTDKLNPAAPDFAAGIGGHDLTLGSGSYDGLVGTGFYARWKRLFLTGAMQYAIRTEGDFGYQFANDWTWFGGPGVYLVMGHKYTLALQAVVSGESKGEDTINGVATTTPPLPASIWVRRSTFTWSDRLSAQIAADLPVSIASSGDQLVPDYRIRAAHHLAVLSVSSVDLDSARA